MAAVLFILLGVVLTLGALIGGIIYLCVTSTSGVEAHLAHLEELRAERRVQQITQDAVAQMLAVARNTR